MPELSATLKAMYKVESRKNKFSALLQGVNLEGEGSSGSSDDSDRPTTLQEIQARAHAKLTGNKSEAKAIEYGFTSDMGVEYQMIGDIDG
jgi:hypothetical protein